MLKGDQNYAVQRNRFLLQPKRFLFLVYVDILLSLSYRLWDIGERLINAFSYILQATCRLRYSLISSMTWMLAMQQQTYTQDESKSTCASCEPFKTKERQVIHGAYHRCQNRSRQLGAGQSIAQTRGHYRPICAGIA